MFLRLTPRIYYMYLVFRASLTYRVYYTNPSSTYQSVVQFHHILYFIQFQSQCLHLLSDKWPKQAATVGFWYFPSCSISQSPSLMFGLLIPGQSTVIPDEAVGEANGSRCSRSHFQMHFLWFSNKVALAQIMARCWIGDMPFIIWNSGRSVTDTYIASLEIAMINGAFVIYTIYIINYKGTHNKLVCNSFIQLEYENPLHWTHLCTSLKKAWFKFYLSLKFKKKRHPKRLIKLQPNSALNNFQIWGLYGYG